MAPVTVSIPALFAKNSVKPVTPISVSKNFVTAEPRTPGKIA